MPSSSPLVSVIIDNYNYARFLGPAIASGLAQTYPRVEVIVVDDGSTDSSREVMSSYHGLIRSVLKANGGQASAMNAGCDVSHGQIVMFLDSDDLLYPDAVDRVVGRLGPGDSKAHFRLQVIDDEGRPGPGTVPARKFPLGSGDVVAEVLRRGRYVSSPNSGNAFPRHVIEHMGPVPGDLRAADTFYGYGAPFLGPVCAIEDVLGGYRMHGTNRWDGTAAHGTQQIPHFGVPLDLARHRLVRTLAESHDLVAEGTNLAFRDPNHFLARMASLRLEDPVIRAAFDTGREVSADTALGLLRAAAPVLVSADSGRIAKRVATAALLVALAGLPPSRAGRLAQWYFDPHSRVNLRPWQL